MAARFASKALIASATLAHGRVRLAEGDPADAERLCAEAARLWSDVGAPYEAALARAAFAEALRASGNDRRAALELAAARTVLDQIAAGRETDDAASVEPDDGAEALPVTDINVFRREGDYWSVVFDGHTVRVRDLKGMRYLARLLADPGREFHVLALVAAESGQASGGQRATVRPTCRTQALAMPVRCSTREPRTRTAGASPRSRTTSSKRAPSVTPSEPHRQTRNATSSYESSLARSASAAATGGPHQRPRGPESASPAPSARR